MSRRQPWADLLTLDDWKREAARLTTSQPPVTLRAPSGATKTFPSLAARDAFLRRQIGHGMTFRTFPLTRRSA